MAGIDAEKTDVAAGLVAAKLLQEEAAAGGPAADGAGKARPCGRDLPPAATVEESAALGEPSDGEGGDGCSSAQLLAWAAKVCHEAADSTPAAATTPASAADVRQALHYARFATAAYGARQHFWRRGATGACAARARLRQLAAAARAADTGPLAGWTALRPSGSAARQPRASDWRHLAAARELLGPGCPVVALSAGDRKRGLLPHLVALDL